VKNTDDAGIRKAILGVDALTLTMFLAAAWAIACSSLFFIVCLSFPVAGVNDRQLHRFQYSLFYYASD